MRLLSLALFMLFTLCACLASAPQNPFTPPSLTASPTVPATITPTPFQPLAATPITPTPPPPTASPTPAPTPTPTSIPRITLLFTGAIVPARCVQAEIDRRGEAEYIYAEIVDTLSSTDLTIGTLNASLSDFPEHTGCVGTFTLVGGAINADAMADAGFDGMSVATNHIKDCGPWTCGDTAFLETLENLRRVGIWSVGAGKDHDEAMQPMVVTVSGVRFGFVSLGQINSMAFAGEEQPGIAELNETNLYAAIAAARELSDVVIVMPHWGPEYSVSPNWSQRSLARSAVEAGADLVVGNHTHVVQAVQEIDGITVFYGLGSLVFDQNWSRETQQGMMALVTFEGTQMVSYELIPTHVDGNGTVHLADEAEAEEILARVREASEALK